MEAAILVHDHPLSPSFRPGGGQALPLPTVNLERVHGAMSGCTVLGEMHPVSAHNKSLISDTDMWVLKGSRYVLHITYRG